MRSPEAEAEREGLAKLRVWDSGGRMEEEKSPKERDIATAIATLSNQRQKQREKERKKQDNTLPHSFYPFFSCASISIY